MSISLLRKLLMKEAVKDTAGSSGIMSINKNIAAKVEQQLQKYVNDAMQQGVDLDTLSPQQLKMIVQMNKPKPPRVIAGDSPEGKGIMEALLGKRGEVVDMAGKKLDTSQGIMGGKSVKELMDSGQVTKGARGMKKSKKVQDREMFQGANKRLKTEAQLKAEMEASNKKAVKNLGNKRQLTEDEYQDFLDEVGGADQLEAYDFDGTVGSANKIKKQQADYMAEMEMEFKKGKLDPEPGSRTPQRKRFLQSKLDEAEASGDARLLSREEREELFDLDDIPEYALGGRAGFRNGNTVEDKIKEMIKDFDKYRKGGGKISYKKFKAAYIPENFADGGVAGLLGERTGFRGGGAYQGGTSSRSRSRSSPSRGPAGGASAGGNYGGNVNPQQTYAGRTLSQRPSNYGGTKPTTVTPSGGSNIKTGPYLGSTINFKTSRNPFKNYKRHAILANMLKKQMIPGGNIPNYHQISAYDFDNRLGLPNPVSKSLATGYQYLSEAKKALTNPNYNFSDATSRAKEESRLNKMGIEGLDSKDMQNYQRALDYTNIDSLDDMRTFKAKYLADGGPARQNFKMGKRAFLKMLAGTGAGIVGLKSGLFGLGGKEATKKAVTETVKQSAGSGRPPPYFFKLVDKIKFMGDDVLATQDKAIAKKYKDYVLEEDFAGNISIIRKGDMDAPGYEEVYMGYSVDDVPLKGKKGSTKVEEYDEYTVRPDEDGKMKDVEDGVPEDVLDDAGDPDSMTLKKASGGIARMLGE
jgi:hypothetical protein